MTENIDELKEGYRNIKAPPQLATRIRAEVAEQTVRRHTWMPAGATVMALVLVVWLAPLIVQQSTPPALPGKPSLTAIAALKPDAPAGTSVSLSQLKTVKKPKLPAKPQLKSTKPQTKLESENDLLEEKDYVHS